MTSSTTEASALVFVSVVFDAEIELQNLQARSFARFVPTQIVDQIIVIDNTVFGIHRLRRSRMLAAYGPHAGRVAFIRVQDLAVNRGADGWRSQQAAKLLVSRRIRSPYYVVLDAKNHFIRDISVADFIGDSGTPHGGRHSYDGHPLRHDLETTLTALGMGEEAVTDARASFPVTATPFVMITDAVRAGIDDLEHRTGLPFAAAFERERMLEFFYYSGWMALNRPQDPISDGIPIEAPAVWGSDASADAVRRVLAAVEQHDAPVLGVHRRALMRSDRRSRAMIREFWTDRELLSSRSASALMRRFRFSYRPAMALTRLAERLRRASR